MSLSTPAAFGDTARSPGTRAFPWTKAGLVLVMAAVLLIAAALNRSTEYDENYSVFITGGTARPDWPSVVFTPESQAGLFTHRADAATANQLMRTTDVHPPLYFIALSLWRAVVGNDLVALRAFSVILALGAVLVWMRVAWLAGLPPIILGLVLALSYGFEIMAHVVRGYVLAQLLMGLTVWCALAAQRPGSGRPLLLACLAGLAGGLATCTHYFSAFPVVATLGWMVLATPGWGMRLRLGATAAVPSLLLVGVAAEFWLAQRAVSLGQSVAQFPVLPFPAALSRLAQYNAAGLLGGLPLYVPAGLARILVGGTLVLLLAGLALAILLQWRHLGRPRWLWLLGALVPSLALLPMGALFGAMPIELRYLVLAAPFVAALVTAAFQAWSRKAPQLSLLALGLLLTIQATSSLGLILHPATQQPFRSAATALAAAISPTTLVVLPFGQDGVGIVGSMLRELPFNQPILLLRSTDASEVVRRIPPQVCQLVLLNFGDRDAASAIQYQAARKALDAGSGWTSGALLWQEQRGGSATLYTSHAAGC